MSLCHSRKRVLSPERGSRYEMDPGLRSYVARRSVCYGRYSEHFRLSSRQQNSIPGVAIGPQGPRYFPRIHSPSHLIHQLISTLFTIYLAMHLLFEVMESGSSPEWWDLKLVVSSPPH